jgi:hypothetical protein
MMGRILLATKDAKKGLGRLRIKRRLESSE